MAKTYNQIKNSVLGKSYDINSNTKRKEEEKEKSYDEIKSGVLSGKYDFSKVKSRLESEIGLDTLGNDITSLNKRLTESATGWQTSETLNTVRSSMDSMQSRLQAYKEYEKLFGGGGDSLKDLRSSYSSAMDNWDGLIEQYGNYNNAEAYTKETEMLANLGKMTSSDVEAKINEIKELEDIFNTARGYANKMKGATQNARNFQNRSGGAKSAGGFADDIKGAEKNLNDYLSSVGYKSVDEIEKALGAKGVAYTTVNGENITWQSLYKQKKEQEETDALYKEVSANDDFKKYKYEGMNVKNPEFKDSKGQRPLWFGEDVENKAEFARDNREAIALSNAYASFGDKNIYYTYLNDQEREMYNYYLGKEKAGLLAKGTSDNYLDSLDKKLKDRHDNQMLYNLVNYTKESPLNATLASGISVWQNLGAGGEWLIDSAKYLQTGELDKNQLAQGSSAIRSTVSNMVDWEIGNWDAFDFVYNSSMSMIDSATAMATLGGAGGVALGLSAAAQGTNDALDRGLDNRSAFFNGLASGVFEGVFETYSIGKFKSLKELPSSGVKSIIKNISKSMLVNASEETLTEIANITYDNIVNGDLSDAKTKIRAYVNAGLSESEAKRKVALEQGTQVAEAGASGAFMGLGFGGVSSGISYHNSKTMGRNIKANDRAGDVFDLANNPEIASAYKAYTDYANKGIGAKNATNAQVGSLAQMVGLDAKEKVNSKKITPEQKAEAQKTLDDLKIYSEGKRPESRQMPADNINKRFVREAYDSEVIDALIESGIESAEGTEAHRLAKEYKAKIESGKNLSVDEIKRLSDANDMAIKAEENAEVANELIERGESKDIAEIAARKIRGEILTTEEGAKLADSDIARQVIAEHNNAENVTDELLTMAQSMESKDRALFVALYDGKTDVEAYANAFNLAVMKSENNYSENDILKTRSVLSGTQVAKIYEEARIKADKAETDRFKSLVKATADKKFYKGNIDDSVIDYNNTSAEGKVNWKDLDSRQRQAITFMNGFAQAVGLRLVWTKDDAKANGSYNPTNNTLTLDVYAGIDHVDKLSDTIIPTASHELTHWMEKKSPEFFRKVNNLVFNTLYEHDGISEEERIRKEMARLKKSNPDKNITEAMARSEIIARACEEVLSKSEQGKKIFNSLSKSEQKTFVDKIKEIIQDIVDWISDTLGLYGEDSLRYEARVLRQYQDKLNEIVKLWDAMLAESVEVNQALEKNGEFTSIGARDLSDLSGAVDTNGEELFQYKAMVEDEERYREMLLNHMDVIGITKQQINDLFTTIDKAVDIISNNLEILDYAWESDINDRAFSPMKPNSDSLYKVSLDFSTLCRKRLLQQTIQQTLQNALNMNLSTKDSIAIRDELMKIQEEGRKIEVACALCYVESARMKSPKQITRFLNEREAVIKEFFANRNEALKPKIKEAEMKAREALAKKHPDGFYGKNDVKLDALTASKSDMKKADADFIRAEEKMVKASYELSESEQAELDVAMGMTVNDFTSAKGLESLAKNHPDLFDAYTSFIRNATHSKGIESDTWWRAGDSDSIGDSLIAKMNEENGLRSQSWSDFQVIHLLDYIAATIELSTKGAKRQSYTKVPDYVKLLGNTGDMINLSLIPENVFNGKLSYDGVEGMAYDIALKLRDEYHATVGTICIGINDEQIRMLLADATIDYVIPYHHSSMSKATRKLMHIPAWESYEKTQSEKKLSSDTEAKAMAEKYGVTLDKEGMWQKSPKFSEWFNLEEAQQIAKLENEHPSNQEAYKKYGVMYGGYMAMQKMANNYLKLCASRGLAPKFSTDGVDFTQEENYWKLLIDRKMVDNVTGEVIEQKAIKPIFSEKSILEILDDELARYPQVKADQEYATRKVTEKFLSGEMKNLDKATMKAIKKPIDNVTEVNILESSRDLDTQDDSDTLFSMREDVEETKDLVAVHNINEAKLADVIRRGQFLMPSLAVTNKGHTAFGDISVIFRKNTIDPLENAENKLYGADAWTPTQTRLKKNPVFNDGAVSEALRSVKGVIGNGFSQLFDVSKSEFKETLRNADGSIYDAYSDNIGMQTAYALKNKLITKLPKENGKINTEVLEKQISAKLDNDAEWGKYKRWLEGISDSVIESYDNATNEDILRNMKSQPESAKPFRLSENGELTVPAKEYTSVDEYKANKHRLSEDAESQAKAVGQEFVEWAKGIESEVAPLRDVVGAINSAFAERYNADNIVKAFAENGIEITRAEAKGLQSLYKKAVELPAPYFEAKPNRAVGLNEVAFVVIPSDASAELRGMLAENGVKYKEYESGNNKERINALNSEEDVLFSERDSEYLELAKNPKANEARLRELVEEAARKAGYNSPLLYHGTPLKMQSASRSKLTEAEYAELDEKYDDKLFPFVVFNTERNFSKLTYTATNRKLAEDFAYPKPGTVFALYGKFTNPLVVDEHIYSSVPYYDAIPTPSVMKKAGIKESTLSTEEIAHWAKENNYDGVIIKGIREGGGVYTDDYIVFSSSQLKSADLVTYDENGNIIPLSERFNDKKDSILYSERDGDFNLDNYSIDDLIEMSDGYFEALYKGLGLDKLFLEELTDSDVGSLYGGELTIDDISEELNAETDKVEILIRREGLGKSHVEENHTAVMTKERIDRAIEDSGAKFHPDYAQKYITRISPKDFIDLTVSQKNIDRESFDNKVEGDSGSTMGDFDYMSGLRNSKASPYLSIDRSTGRIIGHNGRHRLRALEMAGIESVEIEVQLFEDGHILKYNSETIPDMAISSQFDTAIETRLSNIIPLNEAHREEIERSYGEKAHGDAGVFYSERVDTSVYETMGELDNLRKENEKIKIEVESLKERLAIEKTITHGNYVDTNKALTAAGHIRNIANSTYDKVKLAKEIKGIYTDLMETPGMKSEALFRRCHEIADNVLKEAKEEVVVNSYFKGVLKDIRSTRISLDEMQKQEAKHLFGDHYNRSFMGRVVIANDGTSLDSQWQEWANRYPDIFDADVNPNDQIGELHDIISTLQESSETVEEFDMEEKRRWLAQEVLNTFWNLPTVETTADKYTKKIAQLRAEHNRRISEVRDSYKAKLTEQRMVDDIYYKKKLSAMSKDNAEKMSTKLAEVRDRYSKLYSNLRERMDAEVALAKSHGREMMSSYKERAEMKTKIQSITSNSLTLNEWLVKNSKDKHIHEAMKGPVVNLLHAINFSSKSMLEKGVPTQKDMSLRRALRDVQSMMIDAEKGQEVLVELYGHGLNDAIKEMVDNVEEITSNFGDNEFILNKMSLSDLDTLDKTVKTIKQAVSKMNKFHTVNHAMGIANLSQNSMQYLDSLGEAKLADGMRGIVKKSLSWSNTLPHYAFKRYGEGGKRVYEAIQDGWDKFSFNTKQILDYSNEAYTSEEVKKWSEDVKTFRILVPTNSKEENYEAKYQTIKMTVPQIMSLYSLQKRSQAKQHLFQGGIRVADFKDSKGNVVSQSKGAIFTESDVDLILDSLTNRQKAVADKLQEFMNTVCAEWGNEVSMARFGYKAFGEENYFPIQSDKNNLRVNDETEQNNSLFRLLNMSFTKSLVENANNRIVISDIFDVFAQHTSDMAKYNALALPVLDAFRWYNYTEKQEMGEGTFETHGVKQSLESAFGKEGQNYFTTFLKDINGQQEADRETLSKSFMRNYKIATVGANIRVVALQPTSYVRASAVIDSKYLVKALMHKPKSDKAKAYCGIALWKSMGYFDTNIQRGVTSQIKHEESLMDKVTELSMKGAGVADELTWGYLWNAAELEIREKQKDLKVGSKEFYDAVGKRLREIIYATQVVDSTMTRSQLMRSTKMHDQIMTNFASEPTLSYNMLLDAYSEYSLDVRRMGKKEAVKKNASRVARVLSAYTMTNAVAALVESVFDAYRDDDDEELTWMKFAKLYLSNFGSDMSITAKLPYIKEIHSLIKGYSVSRSEFAWAESSYKAITGIIKNFQGKGQPSATIKNSLKSISYLSSLPIYNLYRDTMAALNKLDLFTTEDLNEMFGDFMD